MINSTSSLINFASVINNIVCSAVGCIFLSQIRSGLVHYQRRSALYFFYFFLVFGFAFAAMAIRSWLPLIYSVLINNFMYMTVAYLLLFGSISWYERDIQPWLWKLSIVHVCLYTATQLLIYQYIPDTLELRVQIAFVNFAVVYASTFLLCHKHRASNGKGERMLALSALVCLVAAGFPTFALAVTGQLEYYRVAVIVTQNIVSFFLLGGLLSLFLFNQIDWHYERSIRDELTGLFNRRYINERISHLFQGEEPILGTLAVVDIDHFKKVNDRFGHDVGDKAIVCVANVLSDSVKKGDLVGRYGGEEFLIFIAHNDSKQALATLHAINSSVELQSSSSAMSVPITVSIGYCNLTSQDTLQSAFKRADSALYMAKSQGRNCIVGH